MLKVATIDTFDEGVVEASRNKLILVDFWAPWCGPCKMLRPILERITLDMPDEVEVAMVDASTEQLLADRYSVSGTPTVLFFKDGEVVNQFTGVKAKSALLEEIQKFL